MQFDTNSPFMQHMGDTFRRVAVPALALGAGTGALSGFMSSKAKPGEDGRARRNRVLRNALLGAALGTTAGVGLPMGYEALNTPLHTNATSPVESGIDKGLGWAAKNPLLLGAGGGAFLAGKHLDTTHQTQATEALRSGLRKGDFLNFGDKETGQKNIRMMASRPAAGGEPSGAEELIRRFREGAQRVKPGEGNPADMGSVFRANELMQEAGHNGMSLADMKQIFETKAREGLGSAGAKIIPEGTVRSQFLDHVGGQGMLGSALKNLGQKTTLPFAEQIAKVPGLGGAAGYDPVHLAEMYSKYVRPSAAEVTQRWLPAPLRWGLLGAGVLGANEIQKRLTGQ